MQGDAGDFDDNSLVKLHCLPMPAGGAVREEREVSVLTFKGINKYVMTRRFWYENTLSSIVSIISALLIIIPCLQLATLRRVMRHDTQDNRRITTCLLTEDRWTNDNQPATGTDK